MANCSLNRNILKSTSCGYSLNKVNTVYLANYDDVDGKISLDTDGYEVTAITGGTFYKIVPSKDSASFTDELQVTDSGAKYRTHTLNFAVDGGQFNKALAKDVDAISLGRYVCVAELAAKDDDGKVVRIMLGRTTPLEATVASVSGAASATDSSPITFTLVSDTAELVLPLKSDVVLPVSA